MKVCYTLLTVSAAVIAEEANLAFAYAQGIFDLVVPVVDNGEGGEFKETVEPRVAVAV